MVAEPKKQPDLSCALDALQDIADALCEAAAGVLRLREPSRIVDGGVELHAAISRHS